MSRLIATPPGAVKTGVFHTSCVGMREARPLAGLDVRVGSGARGVRATVSAKTIEPRPEREAQPLGLREGCAAAWSISSLTAAQMLDAGAPRRPRRRASPARAARPGPRLRDRHPDRGGEVRDDPFEQRIETRRLARRPGGLSSSSPASSALELRPGDRADRLGAEPGLDRVAQVHRRRRERLAVGRVARPEDLARAAPG